MNICVDRARHIITAHACDIIDKRVDTETIEQTFESMRTLLDGKPAPIAWQPAANFWRKIDETYLNCNSNQRHQVKAEILRILTQLEGVMLRRNTKTGGK